MFDAPQAIDAVREVLPSWVVWGRLFVWPVVAFVVTLLSIRLGLAIGLRRFRQSPHAPWMQRARDSSAAFSGIGNALYLLPILFALVGYFSSTPFEPLPSWCLAMLAGIASWFGAVIAYAPAAREVRGLDLSLRYVLSSYVAVWLLLAPNLLLAMLMLISLPPTLDARAITLVVIAYVAFVFFSFGGGLRILRLLGLAWPAPLRLQEIVARASRRAGIAIPPAFVVRWAMAQALAFPLGRVIAFSDMALAKLNDDELTAICAHELSHLRESRLMSLARMAPGGLLVAIGAARPLIDAFGVWSIIAVGVLFLIVCRLVGRMGRRMEVQADAAATDQDVSTGTYARALEALHRINMTPAVTRDQRAVHPDLYDRLLAAGATPSEPRPAHPSLDLATATAVAAWSPFIVATLVAWVTITNLFGTRHAHAGLLHLQLALAISPFRSADTFSQLAERSAVLGDSNRAMAHFRAAAVLEPQNWSYPAQLAGLLASAGRPKDALTAVEEARRRFQHHRGEFYRPIPNDISERADWESGASFRVIDDALKAVATCRDGG